MTCTAVRVRAIDIHLYHQYYFNPLSFDYSYEWDRIKTYNGNTKRGRSTNVSIIRSLVKPGERIRTLSAPGLTKKCAIDIFYYMLRSLFVIIPADNSRSPPPNGKFHSSAKHDAIRKELLNAAFD